MGLDQSRIHKLKDTQIHIPQDLYRLKLIGMYYNVRDQKWKFSEEPILITFAAPKHLSLLFAFAGHPSELNLCGLDGVVFCRCQIFLLTTNIVPTI